VNTTPAVESPIQDEPGATALLDRVGGPVGRHGRPHWWWTPVRVLLAGCTLAFLFGMVQHTPCVTSDWNSNATRYGAMCYSDIPYLYTGRGLAEQTWPYSHTHRYPAMEYPVGISVFAWGVSVLTALHPEGPAEALRAAASPDALWSMPGMDGEINEYFILTVLLLFGCALGATYLLATADPRRPWAALPFAVTPLLPLAGMVNWDLLAVVAVAGALWAWMRDRPLLAGVCIGLGTSIKLYPLFLLGALLVICLHQGRNGRRRWWAFAGASFAAALTWLVTNVPIYLENPQRWKHFWSFNSDRGADLGSLWLAFARHASPHTINLTSWLLFGLACLAILAIGLKAPRTPTLAQLGFLIVAAFLIVNKVYSPQYVLWLLPLAALARPRWRDMLVWQVSELIYFAGVWLYLGGWLEGGSGGTPAYTAAIVVRVAGELYLGAMIIRDLWMPRDERSSGGQRVGAEVASRPQP